MPLDESVDWTFGDVELMQKDGIFAVHNKVTGDYVHESSAIHNHSGGGGKDVTVYLYKQVKRPDILIVISGRSFHHQDGIWEYQASILEPKLYDISYIAQDMYGFLSRLREHLILLDFGGDVRKKFDAGRRYTLRYGEVSISDMEGSHVNGW